MQDKITGGRIQITLARAKSPREGVTEAQERALQLAGANLPFALARRPPPS